MLPKSITFRCYAELNDFLPDQHRQKPFVRSLMTPVTLGEAIESLGIPLSEVDLVLVNGEPSVRSRRLYDNDYVSLYPTFEALDISSLKNENTPALRVTRFILDAHLGKAGKSSGKDLIFTGWKPTSGNSLLSIKSYNTLIMNKFMFVILISGLTFLPLTAQPVQPEKFREVYFSMDPIGTKTYGIQYKTGLNEHTILRFAFSSFDAGFTATSPAQTFQYPSSTFGIGTDMEAGLEKRVSFTEKVSAFYGIDFVFGLDWMYTRSDNPSIATDSRNTNDVSFSPGIGFKSGILLDLRNGFFAAAEISPMLFYRFTSDEQISGTRTAVSREHDLGFQANADAMKISLAYRW